MFEFVRRHTRLLQFVLVVLIFPSFVFFGIEGYSSFFERGSDTVAEVDGHRITQADWDEAHRNQIERLRRQMPDVDSSLFEDPQLKRQTLEALVRERVLLAAAYDLNLVTTDARLQRVFANDPQFAFLRNPDGSINRDALAAQGLSPQMFEQRLRQELSTAQVLQGMSSSVIAPPAVSAAAFDALLQQREVQVLRFDAKDYQDKVKVSDADIEAYYKDPANAAQFRAPEQETVEYVVLDIDAIKKRLDVSEEEARKLYEQNAARYTTPQERRASHILIEVEQGASAAERARAKEEAEALLAQVRKDPESFAELARKHSDDPGSAANGGDLEFFGRGAMVKPFEDAAFALKPGEISGVVESDFGYHIIKLTDVRGGESKGFDAVRAQIEEAIRTQKAQQRYAEAAIEFTNLVYEQPDSLKPVVDKLGLELRTAKGVTRTPAPQAQGPLANEKFLEALFSSDAIRNKRNTEAIELGANRMVSGRVVQYTPERTRTLDEVRDEVRARVIAAQAAAQAQKEGEAKLASLKQAPATPLDVPAIKVSRAQPHELPGPVLDAVLKADAKSLPSSVGVDLGGRGYAVVKLIAVLGRDPTAADERVRAQYAQLWSDAEARAYLEALKSRFDVDMRAAVVAPPESSSPASPPGR